MKVRRNESNERCFLLRVECMVTLKDIARAFEYWGRLAHSRPEALKMTRDAIACIGHESLGMYEYDFEGELDLGQPEACAKILFPELVDWKDSRGS